MRSSAKPPRMPSPVEQSLPVLGEEDVSEAVQVAGGHNFLKPMVVSGTMMMMIKPKTHEFIQTVVEMRLHKIFQE
jgi:uncharacterized protein with ACT and thioredoxin-like domain